MKNPSDIVAAQYMETRTGFKEQKYIDEFLKLAHINLPLLDVGCGAGIPIMRYLLDNGFAVSGIDSSTEMLNFAHNTCLEASLIQADMTEFEPSHTYGGIIAWDSVFHVPREKHADLYASFAGWLEPEAPLLITLGGTEWEGTDKMFDNSFFYSGFAPDKSAVLLNDAGFEIKLQEIDDDSSRGHVVILATKKP